jgi:anion-transporting  ArsA/GET3 family ATPase
MMTNALTKILGAQVLRDAQTFVAAFDTLFGGFRQRAEKTYALLQADGTAFLVVATPEPDALREAAYFVERLTQEEMPLAGLVLSRVTVPAATELTAAEAEAAAAHLAEAAASPLDGMLRIHADLLRMADRERRLRRRFSGAHPDVATVAVPALPTDVYDIEGLRDLGELLATTATET